MKIEARNPRTGAVDYVADAASAADVTAIASRLRAAQPAWEALGFDGRANAMRAFGEEVAARKQPLVAAIVRDTGRYAESLLEVDAVLRMIERWAAAAGGLLDDPPRTPSSIPGIDVGQHARPYALAGVVSPWNFPLLLSCIDVVPALAAGCAAIVKPSEVTPRFIEPLTECIEASPLRGVLAFVAGAAETGEAIVDNADVVCFTGSVPTGRLVGERAARRFIPAFLELGGKDAAIVLASADLERASSALVWGSTANAGQACQSIERIYADSSIAPALVEQLVAKCNAVRLAFPAPDDGELGPIIAPDQVDVVEAHLADAYAKGASALCGGHVERLGGGAYLRPTVLTNVNHSMKVMTEETFAPILPVMSFDGVDDALAKANDTIYGLSGAVFAGTDDEALAVAARMNAGAISVNDAALTAFVSDGEKNSFGMSGLGGSRMGAASIRRFVRRQAFLVSQAKAADPWWYPPLRSS